MKRDFLPCPALAIALAASEPTDSPNSQGTALQGDSRGAPESSAVYWNEVARGLVVKYAFNAFQAIRGYAVVSVAQDHAASAISANQNSDTRPTSCGDRCGFGRNPHLSLPRRGHRAWTLLDQQLAAPRPGEDIVAGKALGQIAADDAVRIPRRRTTSSPHGRHRPHGPGSVQHLGSARSPDLRAVRQGDAVFPPLGDQFRPPPPPTFVAGLPGRPRRSATDLDTRTTQQYSLAKFWAFPAGTYAPSATGTKRRRS